MERISAAVIGAGFIGPVHVEALKRVPGVDVVALASDIPEQAAAVAEHYSVPRVYSSWQEAIRDPEVSVIHNCTPNHLHFAINKTALLAGKHVLSEKPLTTTSKESGELVALIRKTGLITGVNYNYRFYPIVQHAREMAREGELGRVYLVHGHYLQDWLYYPTDYNWRLDRSISGASRAVADIGTHWFDLVQFVTGSKITAVCANLSTVHRKRMKPARTSSTFKGKEERQPAARPVTIGTEDTGTILLEFDSGATGTLTVSQVSAGRKNREWFEIDGSVASIAWDQEEPNLLWIGHREKPNEILIKDPSLLHKGARRYAHYPGGHPEGYPDGPKNLFMNFYRFIRENKDPRKESAPFPTFEDGHWENKVVEAILASHRKRGWVKVK